MQKYLSLFILLILFSCSPENSGNKLPEGILSKEKMTDMLADIHTAEALVRMTPHLGDTNTQTVINYYAFIYKKHGVSEADFKKSFEFYVHQPILFDSIYSDVITKLSDKEVRVRGK
ncbi:MAG: DUF4296 domain-containing protein [Bacteroidia bacterium]